MTVGQVPGDVILQSVPAGNDFSTVLLKEAFGQGGHGRSCGNPTDICHKYINIEVS